MSGYVPIKEDLILSRGGDYAHRYEKDPGDPPFPDGTTAEIVITKDDKTASPILHTWPAEDISSDAIEFWVQADDLDDIPARHHYQLRVHYPPEAPSPEGLDFPWYIGSIKRIQ